MTKNPKKPDELPSANVSADGPIPAENWDNDQRCTGDVDKSKGSVYETTFGDRDKPKK